ncbi:MAG: ribonuclease / adenosylcobalamin/alpha-ribazole phosphatase [Actinomycetota bacterium]|nr:ribonuclease / adenosylcobalamin/alpha-ribazole phosphatase [Actinomycetota bacterium]
MKATLHTDGGARGNPGPAGIGVVLRDHKDDVIAEIGRGIGATTNNVAEYTALIEGLKLALEKGVTDIDIRVDSELLVNQLLGNWKIKSEGLRPLAVKARALMNRFDSFDIQHVRRELNADADRLANQGMDAAALDEMLDREAGEQTSLYE